MIQIIQDVKPIMFAFNNNIFQFKSNSLLTVSYAEITGLGTTIKLYPINGIFTLNLKQYLSVICNIDNFIDTENFNVNTSLIYSCKTYFEQQIEIKVFFTNTTFELLSKNIKYIAGVEQIENYKQNNLLLYETAAFIFLPLIKKTNTHYAKYYRGYPFDISILINADFITNIQIYNNTTSQFFSVATDLKANRLLFDDGLNFIPDFDFEFSQGINNCQINDSNFIIDYESEPCEGIYIKWLNNYGGYSYWLFSNYFQKNNDYKSIGELKTDFLNIENTFARTTQIGKRTNPSLEVIEDDITEMQLPLIESLLESPKVFIYNGKKNVTRATALDWTEIRLDTKKATVRNFKQQNVRIGFSFDLPEKYNMYI